MHLIQTFSLNVNSWSLLVNFYNILETNRIHNKPTESSFLFIVFDEKIYFIMEIPAVKISDESQNKLVKTESKSDGPVAILYSLITPSVTPISFQRCFTISPT